MFPPIFSAYLTFSKKQEIGSQRSSRSKNALNRIRQSGERLLSEMWKNVRLLLKEWILINDSSFSNYNNRVFEIFNVLKYCKNVKSHARNN